MKKIILGIIVAVVSLIATPSITAQVRYGAVAGINVSSLHFNQDILEVNPSVGYTMGVFSELIFPGIGFGVDGSLLYTKRGGQLLMGDWPVWSSQGYGTESCQIHYIDIPINLRFKYTDLNGLEDTFAPFAYVGPQLSFQIGHSDIPALEFPFGTFGLNFGLGCELFQQVQVSIAYELGISYTVRTTELDDYSAENRVWKLTAVYLF
ncbi:MAG: outer membrane beta-barrel protein [Bacteroidales bacterium]